MSPLETLAVSHLLPNVPPCVETSSHACRKSCLPVSAPVVAAKVGVAVEGGCAQVTPKGATPIVDTHVRHHMLPGDEARAAHWAHEPALPRVDAQVSRQVRALGEAARANMAPVRLLPRVAPHVLDHHVRVGCRVGAQPAPVHPPATTAFLAAVLTAWLAMKRFLVAVRGGLGAEWGWKCNGQGCCTLISLDECV